MVIVLIDTLRADWLESWGRDEPTSPRIRELAGRSVVFEPASAPAPWTLPSVVSLFTSTLLTNPGHLLARMGDSPSPVRRDRQF